MAFQVSPGIDIREIDLTNIVPAQATSIGAIAGVFRWGPTDEPRLISNENQLVSVYGPPANDLNTETFFTAADYLSYADNLYVMRVTDGNTAVSNTEGVEAKYPGALGNSIQVIAVDGGAYASANATITSATRNAPTADTNINVIVLDADGSWTGTAGTVLETFEDLATTAGAKAFDGSSNFTTDVINQNSKYISIAEDANLDVITAAGTLDFTFTGGTDGSAEGSIAIGTVTGGYDKFKNPEEIDVNFLLQGRSLGTNDVQLAEHLIALAEFRKDAIAFISPARDDVVGEADQLTAVTEFADNLTSTSYAMLDSGYKYRYDKYNDRYVWTPLNGDIAGLCARTDDTRDPWFSPAGYNRGLLKNVIKLAYNPNKTDRDTLYQKRVNPVITQPGTGTLLFGDKTLLDANSAFNRINVRRLFITIEKAIARAAKSLMFEFNDEFTRAQFVNLVAPYLRDVQGRRGIYDFRVVCDETNNTAEMIDRNEFRGDIYVKPARSINYIQLNFVAVRTGVEFEEVVGRF